MEGVMLKLMRVVAAVLLLCACLAVAKDKKKFTLPDFVLNAQTVAVLVDPDAAIPVNDPGGNKTAQDDVEKALMSWGRLRVTMDVGHADLVIVVRKGNKQAVNPTVGGEPPNDRPVVVQQTDNATHIGGQIGHPTTAQQGQPTGVGPGGEIGPSEDMFSVYQGQGDVPLERAPVWRYMAKNALRSPDVPAVGEFKKAVDAAVKEQQERQKQQAQQQQSQQQQPQSKP
jgi:hypothetical protein